MRRSVGSRAKFPLWGAVSGHPSSGSLFRRSGCCDAERVFKQAWSRVGSAVPPTSPLFPLMAPARGMVWGMVDSSRAKSCSALSLPQAAVYIGFGAEVFAWFCVGALEPTASRLDLVWTTRRDFAGSPALTLS